MSTSNPSVNIPLPINGQRCDLDQRDVQPDSLYYSRNWVYRDGKFKVRPGLAAYGNSLGEVPLAFYQYDHSDTHRRTVVSSLTKWWNLSAINVWTDITDPTHPLTGTYTTSPNFRVFYKAGVSYLLGVNGYADAPKKWDGTSATYDDIAGSPPNAKCIACGPDRVLLGNLSYSGETYPLQIDVSAFNDFDSGWLTVQTVNLAETSGQIIEMRELGNLNIVIYKSDAIYVAIPQAQIYPYAFQLVQTGIKGPANSRCVVSTPFGQIYLSFDGNVYLFNGSYVTPLGKAIQAHMITNADLDHLDTAWGYYDPRRQMVFFIYRLPGVKEPQEGICVDLLNNNAVWPISWANLRMTAGWGGLLESNILIKDMVEPLSYYTAALQDLTWLYTKTLFADQSGQIYLEDDTYTTDGDDPIPFSLETGLFNNSQDGRRWITIQEMEHFFVTAADEQRICIELGKSNYGENPTYTPAQIIDIGAGGPYVTSYRDTSRLTSLKIYGNATQAIAGWRGSVANGIPRGLR
jgi:hypothetical protein